MSSLFRGIEKPSKNSSLESPSGRPPLKVESYQLLDELVL